jgi:hypothetical protein
MMLAEARRSASEVVRAGAWQAALELLPDRAGSYVAAWGRIGPVFVPERLEELLGTGSAMDPDEVAHWQEAARLVRVALDEALLALLLADTMTPPDVRELLAPWQKMLTAAHEASEQA